MPVSRWRAHGRFTGARADRRTGSPGVAENTDAAHRPRPAELVSEADPRILDLSLTGLSAELHGELGDHAHAGGADRMAERLETARRVDRLVTTEGRAAVLDETAAFAPCTEAEVLVVENLGDGEAVVHFG